MKQKVKVRAGAFRYDAHNVLVYEVDMVNGFLKFNFREFATEEEHLRHRQTIEINETEMKVLQLNKEGLSLRKIADETGISKSTVGNILKKHKDQVSNVHADTALYVCPEQHPCECCL